MGKKTYQRVVDLLNEHIPAEISRNEFCKITGINRNSIDRYRVGLGSPIHETLEKMADYFGVTVEWLQGKGDLSYEEISSILCGRGLGVPIFKAAEITEAVMESLSRCGTQLPSAGNSERAAYIDMLKSHVARECGRYVLHMRGGEAFNAELVAESIETIISSIENLRHKIGEEDDLLQILHATKQLSNIYFQSQRVYVDSLHKNDEFSEKIGTLLTALENKIDNHSPE